MASGALAALRRGLLLTGERDALRTERDTLKTKIDRLEKLTADEWLAEGLKKQVK